MPAYKMLLHPAEPDLTPGTAALAGELQNLGLLAAPRLLGDSEFYPVGEQFLQLVTFLGCSPAIELDPPDDPADLAQASASGRFCHAFISCSARPRLRADARTPALRCPACKQAANDWPELLRDWLTELPTRPWRCDECGHTADITTLSFRKSAGIASIWLELRGIYPYEARPGTALLDCLRQQTGGEWRTIFLQE